MNFVIERGDTCGDWVKWAFRAVDPETQCEDTLFLWLHPLLGRVWIANGRDRVSRLFSLGLEQLCREDE